MSPAELYTRDERKINGIYYTPEFLANYLTKKILSYWQGSTQAIAVLDPACGDSILLRSFANEVSSMAKLNSTLNFIGVDKDINAILSSELKFSSNEYSCFNRSFINTDGLFPFNTATSTEGWSRLKEKLSCKNGFDIALSNPPWGAEISEYSSNQLNTFQLAKGQFDIYNLFIEVTLDNLKEGGLYGFILPDSLFSQEQSRLRHLLANTTSILLIARLGEKIFKEINRACVIIIGRKEKAKQDHLVECFRLTPEFKKQVLSNGLDLEQVEKALSHKVPQNRFLENNNFIFDIDLRVDEQRTFKKIENSSILKTIVNNARGAEISKKGIVCQCPVCNNWLPYPKSKNPECKHCFTRLNLSIVTVDNIILNHNGVGNVKLKVGEDLYRYTSRTKSWINTLKEGINYKNLAIYNGNKILVRKTGVGITASIDYDNSIVNQVVYMLKLKPEFTDQLTIEFVLAILNSRAITYYLLKKYGENEWKSHPYLTQTMLINLPFPHIDSSSKEQKEYINKVTTIIKTEVASSNEKNISKQSDLVIERIVAYFFNLDKNDYKTIIETLSSADQLIPIKRLLNCSHEEIFEVNGI